MMDEETEKYITDNAGFIVYALLTVGLGLTAYVIFGIAWFSGYIQ